MSNELCKQTLVNILSRMRAALFGPKISTVRYWSPSVVTINNSFSEDGEDRALIGDVCGSGVDAVGDFTKIVSEMKNTRYR